MSQALDKVSEELFGRKRSECTDKCVTCGMPVTPESFRDKLSLKEFGISRMCQTCQDEAFEEYCPSDGSASVLVEKYPTPMPNSPGWE